MSGRGDVKSTDSNDYEILLFWSLRSILFPVESVLGYRYQMAIIFFLPQRQNHNWFGVKINYKSTEEMRIL